MYELKKTAVLILCTASIFIFSACRSASPETAPQELCACDRYSEDGASSLCFHDNTAVLTVSSEGEAITLKGEYFADDDTLTIVTSDCGNTVFSYRFERGRLYIGYSGLELCLEKRPEDKQESRQ